MDLKDMKEMLMREKHKFGNGSGLKIWVVGGGGRQVGQGHQVTNLMMP